MTSGKISALVTGATGFVGSRLVCALAATNFDVHVVVRPGSNLKELAPVMGKVKIAETDGSTAHLTSIVAEAHPDLVYHLASRFVAEHRPDQVTELMDANVRFGAQLLEAMAANRVRRIVNTGTSWQHFERSVYRPVCLYAATKQAFEAILDFYIDAHGFRAITLKLFDTYGPDDPRPKLFSLLESAARQGLTLEMSAGEQLIDLVYINDVVEAFLVAGKRLFHGESGEKEEYAVSSGRPLPLRQVVALYAAKGGAELKVHWGARPYRRREVMVPWNHGAALPGWAPSVSLEEGIDRIINCAVVEPV